MLKLLRSRRGEGYIDTAVMILCVMLVIAVAVLIALWIAPAVTLLTATTAYALSGPLLWFRRRHTPVQDTHV